MTGEDRLRQLMRDPRWSLPGWPDAPARVRRAARRQRLTAIGAAVAAAVIAATAAWLPFALPGRNSANVATGPTRPAVRPTTVRPTTPSAPAGPRRPPVPPVGSAGFPARIYPAAAEPRAVTGLLGLCPAPAGLEAPGPATPAAARIVLRGLGRGFTNDLRLSDRSAWPLLVSNWRPGGVRLFTGSALAAVRYSGPLRPGHAVSANLQRAVAAGCGSRVARSTWVIVYGPAHEPALDSVVLFVTRRGHMLFYNAE
jgi:hypothetical protein